MSEELHDIQDIFFTAQEVEDDPRYESAKAKLS
jgi:hypothetical protein